MHQPKRIIWAGALLLALTLVSAGCPNPAGGGNDGDPDGGDDPPPDTTPPGPVSGLGASVLSATQIELAWTDPADADLAAIVVRWSPGRDSDTPLRIDPGSGTTVVAGLLPETAYTLAVVALDESGNASGPTEATGTTLVVTFSAGTEITNAADGARSVYAADLDGDGDIDVLSASAGSTDDRVTWYENTDGNGAFSTGTDITTSEIGGPTAVFTADLDGDGDADVLSASQDNARIAWFENNGSGLFSAAQDVAAPGGSEDAARSVFAVDLDGDGDLDVLAAIGGDPTSRVTWYENTGGTFSAGVDITTAVDGPRSVYAADLDGDGDPDVLSASGFDDRIAWYQNTGGTFATGTDIASPAKGNGADSASAVYAIDLDGDGDIDVLSASGFDDRIVWYENTDGNGTFSTGTEIASPPNGNPADGAEAVYAIDLDGDGDADVLSASSGDDRIVWYENNGSGIFSAGIDIAGTALGNPADAANSVYAVDIDGDGDADVLSSSQNDGRIVWYENRAVVAQ